MQSGWEARQRLVQRHSVGMLSVTNFFSSFSSFMVALNFTSETISISLLATKLRLLLSTVAINRKQINSFRKLQGM